MSYHISKDDFGCSKEHCTYKIKCPGVYKLKENISFNPKKNKVPAILICSDNVILDLNGKILKQSSHNDKTQITGIIVKTGHKNVTILGSYGVIKNFSQRGIYVEGSNDYITIGDDTQLTVTGCGYGTKLKAFVENDEGVCQCGVQLGEQEWLASVPFQGFNNTKNVQFFNGVLNHLVVKNLISSGNNIGCILGEGTNYSFFGCSMSQNKENRLIWEKIATLGNFYKEKSVVSYGLNYFSNPKVTPEPNVGVNNAVFENCKFNNNLGEGNDKNQSEGSYSSGLIFSNNFKNLKIKNCQFNQNNSILSPKGTLNKTQGLVIGSGVGTVIEDSEFSDNQGGSDVVGCEINGQAPPLEAGKAFSVDSSESTTLRRCVASRNLAATAVDTPLDKVNVTGFRLQYPSGATLIECISEDNKILLEQSNRDLPSFSTGILLVSDQNDRDTFTNNVEIRSCKLSRNRVTTVGEAGVTGPSQGSSSGIRVLDDLCENIVIRDCLISDNRPDFDEPQPTGDFLTTGLDIFNEKAKTGPSFVTICDNIIQSNGQVGVDSNLDITTIQGNKIINHQTGVILTGGNCGTVIENTILLSETAVEDASNPNPSTNLVAGNKSYNTPCGYKVFYGPSDTLPTEVVSSNLPDFPALPTVSLANIEINNSVCLECPQYNKLKLDSGKYRSMKKKYLHI